MTIQKPYYYPQSKEILKLIKQSKRILVNCHRSPDLDSVGCALAMREALVRMGKSVTVVCPSEIPERYYYLKNASVIRIQQISNVVVRNFDLFISVDTSSVTQLTGSIDGVQPSVPTIVIDHHDKNALDGLVTLVDPFQYSCAEVLNRIFLDWNVRVDNVIATYLYAGIAGDTVLFSVPGYSANTLDVVADLIRRGADKDQIIQKIFRNYNQKTLQTLGVLLQSLKYDRTNRLAIVVINKTLGSRLLNFSDAKEAFADLFFSSIEGVEVGVFFLEADGFVKVGLRSRGKFDCGRFVRVFGGGGHKAAAGAFVKGNLNIVVRTVLKEARRQLREHTK